MKIFQISHVFLHNTHNTHFNWSMHYKFLNTTSHMI